MGAEFERTRQTRFQYPPRKLQSAIYSGPIIIISYQIFEVIRKQLEKYEISTSNSAGSNDSCPKIGALIRVN
jgi:hypothetical protein